MASLNIVRNEAYRSQVAAEILSTEKDYINNLRILMHVRGTYSGSLRISLARSLAHSHSRCLSVGVLDPAHDGLPQRRGNSGSLANAALGSAGDSRLRVRHANCDRKSRLF